MIDHVPLTENASLSSSGFNPRFNASYHVNDDFMVYAEAAKGFRYGGANQPVPTGTAGIALTCAQNLQSYGYTSAPLSFGPDHLWSYSIGEKARLAGGRATLNVDAYYVDWQDVQSRLLLNCSYFFTDNKGAIRAEGVEVESTVRVTPEITISGSTAFNDSQANGNIPTVGAFNGDFAPYSPRWTASIAAYYDSSLGAGTVHAQASYQYRSDMHTTFNPLATTIVSGQLVANGPNAGFAVIPASNNVSASIAYDIGRYEFGIFGNNLTDGNKITDIGRATYYAIYQAGSRVTYARPRTVGARIKVKFWARPLRQPYALTLPPVALRAPAGPSLSPRERWSSGPPADRRGVCRGNRGRPGAGGSRLTAAGAAGEPFAVGFASQTFVQPSQPDVLGYVAGTGALPTRDRVLPVDIWYPAKAGPGSRRAVYAGALAGEDGRDVAFTFAGEALADAPPRAGPFPLVIMAHGYGGTPVAMSWLAENLASKGYLVVGPHFNDPPIDEAGKFVGPLARRPLDIAFVAATAQAMARARRGLFAAADPARTVLIGYSMGGYGVLTAAGASLDPGLAALTHGALGPYVAGGPKADELKVAGLMAVVAISPAGRFPAGSAWGAGGLANVTAPTLFIVGSQDHLVGYDPGVKSLFGQETRAPRYLLTFENAGHSIGVNGAPSQMRARLWDQDWFEDPVWRKDRVLAVQLHFITAFLGLYAKGEAADRAFLDVPTPIGADGTWPDGGPHDAVSPGTPPITLWKGFQRRETVGLELRFLPPAP